MLSLGKSLVVILNYVLMAEQPDPCGPEPYSPGKRPRTRSPLGEGPVTPHVPEEVALSRNSWGPRTSQGVSDPCRLRTPYAIRTPQQGGNRYPDYGGPEPPRVRRRRYARAAAKLPLEDLPTYRIQCGRRLVRSAAAEPEETFARQYCWSRVTKVHSTAAGATHATRVSLLRQLDTTTRRRSIIMPTR